jgi:hypothetical protein
MQELALDEADLRQLRGVLDPDWFGEVNCHRALLITLQCVRVMAMIGICAPVNSCFRLKNNGSGSLFPGFGLDSPIVSWGPGGIAGRGGCQFAFGSKRVGTRSGSQSAARPF